MMRVESRNLASWLNAAEFASFFVDFDSKTTKNEADVLRITSLLHFADFVAIPKTAPWLANTKSAAFITRRFL